MIPTMTTTFSRRLLKLFFVVFCIITLNFLIYARNKNAPVASPQNGSQCHVADWNRVETSSNTISYHQAFSRWLWMKLELSGENNQNYTEHEVLGAYVYPETISITISAQSMVKQRVFCRYYDCQRRELPGATWQSVVFPESVVHCPRRPGVEFVSVSREPHGPAPEPVRLLFRAFERPVHELSVCVAPLYGDEPKWLQIAEFVEHHKLDGVTNFYFHIGNISSYDRRMLDYYERHGDAEVKVMSERYKRPFYAWQLLEIQDCHLRSKFHSRWTAFIDIDERLSASSGGRRFSNLLASVDDGTIGEIQLPVLNIVKDGDAPEEFESVEQVKKDLMSEKYIRSSNPTWDASKALIRSDKIGIMFIHYAVAREAGYSTLRLDASQAMIRHYRATQHRINETNWAEEPKEGVSKFKDRPLVVEFREKLTKNVLKAVQNVYAQVPVNCSTVPRIMWELRRFPDPCERMLLNW